jgi:hypothetical protein
VGSSSGSEISSSWGGPDQNCSAYFYAGHCFVLILIICYDRPSTPIVEVLQSRFLDNWLETMQNKQATIKKERTDATVRKSESNILKIIFSVQNAFKGSYHTKSSLLRQAKIPVEPKPLWKMSKFAEVSEYFF